MIINTLKIRAEYLKQETQGKINSEVLAYQKGNDDFCHMFFMTLEIFSTINVVVGGELGDSSIDLSVVTEETFNELEERILLGYHFTPEDLKIYWQGVLEASKNATQLVELAYQELAAA